MTPVLHGFQKKALVLVLASVLAPCSAKAQVAWNGASGVDSNWTTDANWIGGLRPPTSNVSNVQLGGAGASFAPVVDTPWTLNRLTIADPASYSLTGSQLTFSGSAARLDTSGAAHSIANDINLGASIALTNASNLNLTGAVSGAGSITKSGAGTLEMTGAPLNGGGIAINAGTLQIGTGAPLAVSGNFGGDIVNNGTLAINNDAAGFFVVLRGLSGTGDLVKNGTGTLNSIGPIWTHSGNTTLNAGTIAASINSTGRLTVNGGNIETGGSSYGSLAGSGGTININSGTFTVGGDNSSTTWSGTFGAVAGDLVKTGSGTLILAGAPLNTGSTPAAVTISGGTLQIGDGGALAASGAFGGAVVNNASLVFDYSAAGGSATLGNLSGAGTLVKNGTGTLIMAQNPTATGTTTINAGTLQVGNGGALAASGGFTGGVVNNGALVYDFTSAGGTSSLAQLSGTGSLAKNGSGTLILTANPTHSGATTINAGTLQVGNGGALAASGGFNGTVVNNATLAYDFTAAGGTSTLAAMSGSGNLVKSGSGTLILSAPPAHTGTTTINAGTLQLGNGGALPASGGLGSGLVNNGSLVLDYSAAGGSVSLSSLSGTGGVVKNGTGTLNFTGTNTHTGALQVNAGAVAVNGTIASAVTVNSGASLGGTGTIANALTANAGGVIAPGNSIGTLNVSGSLTFNAGSVFRVEADAAGASDRINVSGAPGTATINGGTVDVQAGAGTYGPATLYTLVNATGGVTGAFAAVTSNLAFLTPSLSYNANNVFLTLTRNAVAFPAVALTPNQTAVSRMLEPVANAGPAGDTAVVINGILGLSAPQARAAFDAIGGASIVELRRASSGFAHGFVDEIDARLRQADAAAPAGRGLWGKVGGSGRDTDGDGNAFGHRQRGSGVALGVDAELRNDVRFGIAASYNDSSLRFDGSGDAGRNRSAGLAVYARARAGAWTLRSAAGLAVGDNRMDRALLYGPIARTARGEFTTTSTVASFEAGYDIALKGVTLRPIAGVTWVRSRHRGFTESAAGALDLAVAGRTTDSLRTSLGAALPFSLAIAGVMLRGEPRLLWVREHGDLNAPLDAALTGAAPGGGFSVAGVRLRRDSLAAGLTVSGGVARGVDVYADARVDGNRDQLAYAASVGVRLLW